MQWNRLCALAFSVFISGQAVSSGKYAWGMEDTLKNAEKFLKWLEEKPKEKEQP